MRGVVVIAFSMLTACNDGGIRIRIYAPAEPGAVQPDHVRLFVGLGEEQQTSIAPPSFDDTMGGWRWDRDPSNTSDYEPIVPPAPVEFDFTSDALSPELGAIIAVGYTAGVPTSSVGIFHPEFVDGRIVVYTAGLNPTADARDPARRGDLNQFMAWGPSALASEETCVLARDVRSDLTDTSHRTSFIVMPNDRDCDGLLEEDPDPNDNVQPRLDCNRSVYMGHREATRFEVSCLYGGSIAGVTGDVCTLGGPICFDDASVGEPCEATKYCSDMPLCTQCGDDWTCARNAFATPTPPVSYLECKVRLQSLTSPFAICEGSSPPFDVGQLLPAGATCANAKLRNVEQSWESFLGDTYSQYAATITPECALTFGATSLAPVADDLERLGGIMTVDVGGSRGLAEPIVFTPIQEDCSLGAIECHWVGPLDDEARRDCLSRVLP